MFALTEVTDVDGFPGIVRMISEGGALVLLGAVLWFLMKRIPAMADRIAESHENTVRSVTDSQAKLVDAFRAEAREARESHDRIVREERAACDARAVRLEGRLDAHGEKIERVEGALSELSVALAKER